MLRWFGHVKKEELMEWKIHDKRAIGILSYGLHKSEMREMKMWIEICEKSD